MGDKKLPSLPVVVLLNRYLRTQFPYREILFDPFLMADLEISGGSSGITFSAANRYLQTEKQFPLGDEFFQDTAVG